MKTRSLLPAGLPRSSLALWGIALADALMGEISPAMANAVAASAAYRVLIPMNLCDTYVAGVSQKSSAIMDDAMEHIRQLLTEMGDTACL